MKKHYRKRPVVITAEQYDPQEGIPEGALVDQWGPCVLTLEGVMRFSAGDYIITDQDGYRYPVYRVIFERDYEEVHAE